MSRTVQARLEDRIAAGTLKADPAQWLVAEHLDRLADKLVASRGKRAWPFRGVFGGRSAGPDRWIHGLYIHGKVGRGKTMLMDAFYETVAFEPKRRVHFHAFMAEIHDLIAEERGRSTHGDPIPRVAAAIAKRCSLLCFDEFHVTDIADAMILGRLLRGLFDHDVVLVATSNVRPDQLYTNGLNRDLFLPAIALLEDHMDVLELEAAADFRLQKLSGHPLYFTPNDAASADALRQAFTWLTGELSGAPAELHVKGRSLRVPEAAEGVGIFTFADLCEAALGTVDYLAVAQAFHTVILADVPILRPEQRSATRRFINLIDTLYDARVGLIVSAAAEPNDLCPDSQDAFLFERTASRLMEMRSESYLASRADRAHAPRPDTRGPQ
jgi:cell division protein ZapE